MRTNVWILNNHRCRSGCERARETIDKHKDSNEDPLLLTLGRGQKQAFECCVVYFFILFWNLSMQNKEDAGFLHTHKKNRIVNEGESTHTKKKTPDFKTITQKPVHEACRSFIYNSQTLETTQMSFSVGWTPMVCSCWGRQQPGWITEDYTEWLNQSQIVTYLKYLTYIKMIKL